ncbi:hypothetical protein [Burkholderia phage BCSR5]|nr:hypothetical protein [Burkholderia phage BCSR5]
MATDKLLSALAAAFNIRNPGADKRNWPEDFPHDNGCYQNSCITCGGLFLGHKRRLLCKQCDGNTPQIQTGEL